MTKSQKTAVKHCIRLLSTQPKPTMLEMGIELILKEAFPEIVTEIEAPIEESKDQLKFDFALDK